MAIPDFQTIMRPLLQVLANDQEHSNAQLYDAIGKQFGVTSQERDERLPSGRQRVLDNRVGWALTYLRAVKATDSSKRGSHRITPRGHALLRDYPQRVDMRTLEQFAEYEALRKGTTPNGAGEQALLSTLLPAKVEVVSSITPEEAMAQAYKELRASLAQELLEKIKQSSSEFFERLVVDVLIAMGYGGSARDAGQTLGRSGDGGLDGVIREDKLGLDVVYLQAKRWEGVVGRPTIQAFFGAIAGARATKGVVITTSTFSAEARDYVKAIAARIVLVDGKELAEFMIDYNVAVSRVSNYEIKRVDSDYFSEL